jgi:hypothetical protein
MEEGMLDIVRDGSKTIYLDKDGKPVEPPENENKAEKEKEG